MAQDLAERVAQGGMTAAEARRANIEQQKRLRLEERERAREQRQEEQRERQRQLQLQREQRERERTRRAEESVENRRAQRRARGIPEEDSDEEKRERERAAAAAGATRSISATSPERIGSQAGQEEVGEERKGTRNWSPVVAADAGSAEVGRGWSAEDPHPKAPCPAATPGGANNSSVVDKVRAGASGSSSGSDAEAPAESKRLLPPAGSSGRTAAVSEASSVAFLSRCRCWGMAAAASLSAAAVVAALLATLGGWLWRRAQRATRAASSSTSFRLNPFVINSSNNRRRPGCRTGEWAEWSPCSATCGGGHRARSRRSVHCSERRESARMPTHPRAWRREPCAVRQCLPNCEAAMWSDWSACSAQCGLGRQVRRRSPSISGCPELPQQRECFPRACRRCFLATPYPQHSIAVSVSLCNGTRHGAACQFFCASHFRPAAPLRCHDGAFSVATCVREECSTPRVENDGGLNGRCEGTMHLSWCMLRCRDGYDPTPQMLTCANGTWQESARCAPRGCGEPPRLRGAEELQPRACSRLHHGEQCSIRCKAGRTPVGSLACRFGQLSFPRCERPGGFFSPADDSGGGDQGSGEASRSCHQPPAVWHGDTAALRFCAGAPSGETCRLRCKAGFVPSVDLPSTFVCQGGTWHIPRSRVGLPGVPYIGDVANGHLPCVPHDVQARRLLSVPLHGDAGLKCSNTSLSALRRRATAITQSELQKNVVQPRAARQQ